MSDLLILVRSFWIHQLGLSGRRRVLIEDRPQESQPEQNDELGLAKPNRKDFRGYLDQVEVS